MQIETNWRISTILKLAHRCPLPVMLPFLTFSVHTIFYFFWEPYFSHKFIRFQQPAETANQPRHSESRTIFRGFPTHQIIAAKTRPKSIETDKSHLEGIVTTFEIDIPDSRNYQKKEKEKQHHGLIQISLGSCQTQKLVRFINSQPISDSGEGDDRMCKSNAFSFK